MQTQEPVALDLRTGTLIPLNLRKPPKTPRCRAPLARMENINRSLEKTSRISEHRCSTELSDKNNEDIISEDFDETDDIQSDVTQRNSRESQSNTRQRHKINDPVILSKPKVASLSHEKLIKPNPKVIKPIKQKGKSILLYCIVIMIAVPLFLYVFVTYSTTENSVNDNESPELAINDRLIENLENNINGLMVRFKKQNRDIWDEIAATVAEVVRHPQKPAILLFFANREDPMDCLAKMVGNASGAALGSDSSLHISPAAMGNDYGSVIEKFREQIREQKIVIIENLLDIHPEAMRALHNLCDRESPLVEKAVYIITMVAKGFKKNDKPINFVEAQLEQKLKSKINPEKLQPLITRITDGAIIPVQPEPDIINCPLRY